VIVRNELHRDGSGAFRQKTGDLPDESVAVTRRNSAVIEAMKQIEEGAVSVAAGKIELGRVCNQPFRLESVRGIVKTIRNTRDNDRCGTAEPLKPVGKKDLRRRGDAVPATFAGNNRLFADGRGWRLRIPLRPPTRRRVQPPGRRR
jgi:hypothetical protein